MLSQHQPSCSCSFQHEPARHYHHLGLTVRCSVPPNVHSPRVSFSLWCLLPPYPRILLGIIGTVVFVQHGALLLYIAVGCINIPFLFECRRFTLDSKYVFCSSSALMGCGNITNNQKYIIFRIAGTW